MSKRPYFTLAVYQATFAGMMWCPEFGSYDRDDVVAEREDYRDHGHRAANLKIVRTASARQSAIDEALAGLNAAEAARAADAEAQRASRLATAPAVLA